MRKEGELGCGGEMIGFAALRRGEGDCFSAELGRLHGGRFSYATVGVVEVAALRARRIACCRIRVACAVHGFAS